MNRTGRLAGGTVLIGVGVWGFLVLMGADKHAAALFVCAVAAGVWGFILTATRGNPNA